MTDARLKDFFDKMVKVGIVQADTDWKKAYTPQFVDKGVGLDSEAEVRRVAVPGRATHGRDLFLPASPAVMPGLVPGIHAVWRQQLSDAMRDLQHLSAAASIRTTTWMAGTCPAMTARAVETPFVVKTARLLAPNFAYTPSGPMILIPSRWPGISQTFWSGSGR